MNFKFERALLVGKLNSLAVKIVDRTGTRGTKRPGAKAIAVDPDLLSHFKGIDPEKVLFITGTNGKSTTNNLINHILTSNGFKVVSNLAGANLNTGVATSLINASDLKGNVDADFYVFETDERFLYFIRDKFPGANLLVTNLQKDQVQRNGDPDFIYRKLLKTVSDFPFKMILNGDEPRSASLADKGREVVYYGVDRHARSFVKDDTFVSMPCPKCRHKIVFDYCNNDGMGSFHCDHCGYTNGEAKYRAENIDFAARKFTVNGAEMTMHLDMPYMLYTYASAAAAVRELAGIDEEKTAESLGSFVNIAGRVDTIDYRGKNIKYMRFKQENPETLQNFIDLIASDPEEKVVVIGYDTVNDIDPFYINSFYAYDCDYSRLIGSNVSKYIFVTDTICYDAANSFIYGGVDSEKIVIIPTNDSAEILNAIADIDCDNVYMTVILGRFEDMKAFTAKEAKGGH